MWTRSYLYFICKLLAIRVELGRTSIWFSGEHLYRKQMLYVGAYRISPLKWSQVIAKNNLEIVSRFVRLVVKTTWAYQLALYNNIRNMMSLEYKYWNVEKG